MKGGLPLLARDLSVVVAQGGNPGTPVLKVEELAWPKGSRVALTGPSGSGKTTLLHVLAGITRPSSGSVFWGTSDISALSEAKRDAWRRRTVGLVFQDFHLVPELDVLDNILLPLRFAGWRVPETARERAGALASAVGLNGQRSKRVARLSRGEQQRTAVARALLGEPRVILADEPTASLDPGNGRAVADLLLRAAENTGATLVVATHDADLIARTDKVVSLQGGRLAGGGRA